MGQLSEKDNEVLKFLKDRPGWSSSREVREGVGDGRRTDYLLVRLNRKGLVEMKMSQDPSLTPFRTRHLRRYWRMAGIYCLDCQKNPLVLSEYYMVHDSIWESVVKPKDREGMLCVSCLENRLGRRLDPGDFSVCLLNTNHDVFEKSPRLLERLGAPQ